MDCRCELNWIKKTDNKMTTDTGITYSIYICEDCKRYYIQRLWRYIEVVYDNINNKWYQPEEFKIINLKTNCKYG